MIEKNKNIIDVNLFEDKLSSMFMQSPNWVCICRKQDGVIIKANNNFSKGIGLNQNEIFGKSIFDLDFLINQQEFKKEVEKLNGKRKVYKNIFEFRTKKKTIRKGYLSLSSFDFYNQDYFIFVFDDRTTMIKIQELLYQSEERYQSVFDNALAGFYIVSSKTDEIIDCNNCFAQLLGYSSINKVIGKKIQELLISPNNRKSKINNKHFNYNCGEILIQTITGQVVWIMNYSKKIPHRNNIEGVIVDITERKKIEELLTQSDFRFRTLIENSSDIIFIINPLGFCNYVSPSINKTLGYSNSGLKNIYDIISKIENDRFIVFLNDIVNSKKVQHQAEFKVLHKNGTYRILNLIAKNFLDRPEILGILINAQDITDKVRAQEEMSMTLKKEQELNRQKTQFISTVSHDFRTPLTNISLNIQLLERYIKDKHIENISKNLDRMSNATKRLTALLNEVSLISKEQSGRLAFNPETYNSMVLLDSIIEQIDYLFQSNVNVEIIKDIMIDVKADQRLISHIVDNLLSNAIKFSPDKNPIQFFMSIDSSSVFNLSVKDKGIGIPDEELKFLFDPYFRASNVDQISGNGLGLSIVKRCVDLHNGTIIFNSQALKGTTVNVKIPLAI